MGQLFNSENTTKEHSAKHDISYPDRVCYAAFSHRDSDCDQPLFGALALGVGNIEFDVHCIDGKLLIGHDRKHCNDKITIQSLYLDPLRAESEGKRLKHPINLFVDFKSEAKLSYQVLHQLIESEYSDIVTFWKWNEETQSVVKYEHMINIIVTGNRDIERIESTPNAEEPHRCMALDGRIEDVDSDKWGKEQMPMISDKFKKVFPNRNVLSDEDREKLIGFIRKCRAKEQKLRFWATKDDESLWKQLIDLDVGRDVIVINTDDYRMLMPFLIKNGC